ncbi:MAG: radical SAM protein [bacterium]|nr:radical SAM protein [bacterium]
MQGVIDPRNQSPKELIQRAATLGLSENSARRLLGSVIGKGECSSETWFDQGILPKSHKEIFPKLRKLNLEKLLKSKTDGFEKAVFRTFDGLAIETVLIPLHKEGAVSLCLSSQVGCVMGCTFCATARLTKRRNLEAWEIVDQFLQCREIAESSKRKVTGVVFMGMGEPFLNFNNVISAAQLFCFPVFNAITAKSITISTVGLIEAINRYIDSKYPFRLSISLGAATDEKRAKLVPVAARSKVVDVMAAAKRYTLDRGTRINLSYVCISGENVSAEDAKALGALIGDTQVRLDLIDVSDSTGKFSAPTLAEMNEFRDALRKYVKQPVVRRYSGGADIQAACGTLAAQ